MSLRRFGKISLTWLGAVALLFVQGCATDSEMTRAQKGAVIGAASGAAAGLLIGSKKDKQLKYAVVGGVLGGAAGALIGNYMDRQAEELRQVAEVIRVDDGLIATMREKVLFDFDKAELKPEARTALARVASVLRKYDKTEITVAGHTDNVGSASYNRELSLRRADAVRLFLIEQGVAPSRLHAMGFGFDRPVASNATAEGRALNRRVELHITPDERLLRDAQKMG
jgi:outer membrane protein OmpA-like peptidoglycan-associated protein